MKKENSKESSAGVAVHFSEEVGCTEAINHVEMNHDSPVNFVTKGKKDGWDNNCEDFSVLNYGFIDLLNSSSKLISSLLVVQGGYYPEFSTGNNNMSPIFRDSVKAASVFISPLKSMQ